ncbi:hypothetical protein LCGC14_0427040 [marine sediment metagenome]|uniref:Uncharacterized protein n=1 Tax=marine sediment metagenome TaxID=412755 RepID=A0A0F9T7A4_9ZZZZ
MMEHMSAINVGSFNNKHIKVIFNNGMTCEGRVILWGDGRSVLIDEESGSLLYIYNTKENVMLVKVPDEKIKHPSPGPTVEAVDVKRPPFTEQPTKLDYESDPNLRLKKLVALKDMQRTAMKDVFTKRLKTFTPTHAMPAYYDTPNFTK